MGKKGEEWAGCQGSLQGPLEAQLVRWDQVGAEQALSSSSSGLLPCVSSVSLYPDLPYPFSL